MTSWVLPDRVEADPLLLRTWRIEDAPALGRAITASLEHLLPWMPWAANEPLEPRDREALIVQFHSQWAAGGDVTFGMFLGDEVIGGTGLHRRGLPDSLEIGYWVHVDHVRRGYARIATTALVDAAFSLPGINQIEISHDVANERSGRIPDRLGFLDLGAEPRPITSAGEEGLTRRWRMIKAEWDAQRTSARASSSGAPTSRASTSPPPRSHSA